VQGTIDTSKYPEMRKIVFILSILILFVACKESDDLNNGKITGVVRMVMGSDSIGMANIKLYLLDKNVTIDTIKFNNQKAYADSVVTDSLGRYCFDKVKPGQYVIVPKYVPGYKITPIGRTLDQEIDVAENDAITIDFDDKINMTGSSELYLSIRINFINMKQSDYDVNVEVARYRRAWVLFVPYMQYVSTVSTYNRSNWNNGTFNCSCQADIPRALTFLCYSWDNYISFDLINSNSESATSPVVESFQCYLPFEKGSAYIEYDGKTKSVTMI
jgi:hypothetical protein